MVPSIKKDIYGFEFEIAGNSLNALALTSRTWRDQVEAFCSHALLVWKLRVEANIDEKRVCWAE